MIMVKPLRRKLNENASTTDLVLMRRNDIELTFLALVLSTTGINVDGALL